MSCVFSAGWFHGFLCIVQHPFWQVELYYHKLIRCDRRTMTWVSPNDVMLCTVNICMALKLGCLHQLCRGVLCFFSSLLVCSWSRDLLNSLSGKVCWYPNSPFWTMLCIFLKLSLVEMWTTVLFYCTVGVSRGSAHVLPSSLVFKLLCILPKSHPISAMRSQEYTTFALFLV